MPDSPPIQQRKGIKRREEPEDSDLQDGKGQAEEGSEKSEEERADDKENLQEEESEEEEVPVTGR